MNAMVLAAGKGTRLHNLTASLPKPMLPVAGRPVLLHILKWLSSHDIREVMINVHHHPEAIMSRFGEGAGLGLKIRYSLEPDLLGTAGGVKAVADFFDDPFLVVYGDVLTDLDLGELLAFHLSRGGSPHATLAVDFRRDASQGGAVSIDGEGRIHRFIEKPEKGQSRSRWVNSGIMILDRILLDEIPAEGFCDFGRDIFPRWLARGIPLYAWRLPEVGYLVDMGTPESYAKANQDWPGRDKS